MGTLSDLDKTIETHNALGKTATPNPFYEEAHQCTFCGHETKVGGYYMGEKIISICDRCLLWGDLQILGIVLGDAIADILITSGNRHNLDKVTKSVLKRIRAEIYKAVATKLNQHRIGK